MEALSTTDFISTFKVTANLGYLRPDGKLYQSLFIVLNHIGQVIAWQFTQSKDLLLRLVQRLHNQEAKVTWITVALFETNFKNCLAKILQ